MKIRKKKQLYKKKYLRKLPEQKNKSKARKNILSFIKYLFVVSLFTTTIVYGAMAPFFNIKSIKAEPTPHYTENALVAASGIRKGTNGFINMFTKPGKFYLFRIGNAERSIAEKCPYIKSAKVIYRLPSSVYISASERQASSVLVISGKTLLIDDEGYLLEVDPAVYDKSLPVIKGLKASIPEPGKKIDFNKDLLLTALNVFDIIKEVDENYEDKLLPDVDYIDVEDKYNISFSLQSRVIVNLGEAEDLNYKINAAHTIFTDNINKNDKGKLDFSISGNPVFTPQ